MNIFDIEIKPHSITPLLATPRTLALIYSGAIFYIGFIDPEVRNSHQTVRQKLTHWAKMFAPSSKLLVPLCGLSGLSAIACYFKTKSSLWLAGGLIMTSIIPISFFTIKPIVDYLLDANKKTDPKLQMAEEEKVKVNEKLKNWDQRHCFRVVISLLTAGVFYLAEIQSTQNK